MPSVAKWVLVGGGTTPPPAAAAGDAPTAAFSATPTSGTAPLTVDFTDASTGSPTGWQWDFQNDGTVDSTAQSPSFTYTTPGHLRGEAPRLERRRRRRRAQDGVHHRQPARR